MPLEQCGWRPAPLARHEAAIAYPLLMAQEGEAIVLAAWQAKVQAWLRARQTRGIMTLRNRFGVIGALFFFAIEKNRQTPSLLVVPFVRLIEPAGGWHGLRATLQAMSDLAQERDCKGVVVQAQAGTPAWSRLHAGLEAIGRRDGFLRHGDDWFRPLGGTDVVIPLPNSRR